MSQLSSRITQQWTGASSLIVCQRFIRMFCRLANAETDSRVSQKRAKQISTEKELFMLRRNKTCSITRSWT